MYQQAVWFEIGLLFWNLPGGTEENYEKIQNNQLLCNLYRDIIAIQENSVCLISMNISDNDNVKDSRRNVLVYFQNLCCVSD
jgi:hypothetical protein